MCVPPLVGLFVQTMTSMQSQKKQAKRHAESMAEQQRQADIAAIQAAEMGSSSDPIGGKSSSQTAGMQGKKKKTLGRSGLRLT